LLHAYFHRTHSRSEYAGTKKKKFKPVIISHHMLAGLKEGQEKMSKSDPDSAIFMEGAFFRFAAVCCCCVLLLCAADVCCCCCLFIRCFDQQMVSLSGPSVSSFLLHHGW
jgi:hypothetical protein